MTDKITDIAHDIICCKSCYEIGKNDKAIEILNFIDKERDNGNIFNVRGMKGRNGFSASLCLSKLMEILGGKECQNIK